MKKSLYLALFLSVVAGLSAVLITAMFDYASPILAERQQQLIDDSMKVIYSDYQSTNIITAEYIFDEDSSLEELYEVQGTNGVSGYVYKATELGRNADITMLIAIDLDGSLIKDIVYLSQSETKGIGDRILSDDYVDSIVGQETSGTDVDLLAGATYSSTAVKTMVEQAVNHYESNKVGDR